MIVHGVTPILNVSDMDASFAWFAKLGWKELWRWGDPTGFGAVGSGPCEIFMCRGGQGGQGKGMNTSTFATFEDETQDKGCWMSWWVEDVDAVYQECLKRGIEVTWPPTDMPWNVREMHVRHPDGHVFRIGKGARKRVGAGVNGSDERRVTPWPRNRRDAHKTHSSRARHWLVPDASRIRDPAQSCR